MAVQAPTDRKVSSATVSAVAAYTVIAPKLTLKYALCEATKTRKGEAPHGGLRWLGIEAWWVGW